MAIRPQLVTSAPRTQRVTRRPSHTFQLRQQAYQIQPFMIAPVLPGETMKNLLVQARVVSDPVKNPLVGWFAEYYFFYVKLRDLDDRDMFEQMMLDLDHDMSSLNTVASTWQYHYGSTIPWAKLCLDRVVAEYFRNEDDTTAHEIDGVPVASIWGHGRSTWLDSVINDADFVTPSDVDVSNIDGVPADNVMASDIDKAMRMWNYQRAHALTDMDFEDYLATFGIRTPEVEQHIPELVRYIREWTYPTNTVNPADGAPSTALSWSIADRADKDRFFREPGFLFGVSVMRPKVYLSGQAGAAVGLMSDALSWLPAIMKDDPYTSLKKVAALSGPLSANTDAYWVDVKDLLLYGDQFVNFALTETNAGMVALPTAGLEKRYPTDVMTDALFVTPATANLIRQDGVVSLAILGAQVDTTPPIQRLAV